jgi:hypothetical protein
VRDRAAVSLLLIAVAASTIAVMIPVAVWLAVVAIVAACVRSAPRLTSASIAAVPA